MSIRVLWESQTEAIIGVSLSDAESESLKTEGMDKLLTQWGKLNKDKHGQHCHDRRKYFSLLALSVDRIMVRGSQVILTTLS